MRRIAILIGLLALAGSVHPQTLPGISRVEQYWVTGEAKIYVFSAEGKEIGRLEAELEGARDIDGRQVYDIHEKLNLDLATISPGFHFEVDQQLTVDAAGHFQRADVTVRVEQQEERITARIDADSGRVVFDRGEDEPAVRTAMITGPVFTADNFMLDQLELMLARRDLRPGETIIVPTISAQGMHMSEYEFQVLGKTQVRYAVFTDSVWQVNMLRPSAAALFVDRQHKLVKYLGSGQGIVAELQYDPFARQPEPPRSVAERIDDHRQRTPIYGFYLLVTFIWLLFLGRDGFKTRWGYILFLLGMIVYPAVLISLVPIQKQYGIHVLAPALAEGRSILVPGLVPSLLTGIIQETLKFLPLLLVARIVRISPVTLISVGAFVGAGFGFAEACHIAAPQFQLRTLSTLALFDRVFMVLLHMTLGAAMGYGIATRRTWQFWLGAIGLHGLATYLVILVQLKLLSINVLQGILAVYDFALLAGMMFLQISFRKSQPRRKKRKR